VGMEWPEMKRSPKLRRAIASDARILDLHNEIDRLKEEADYWRKRAMVARAKKAELLAEHRAKKAELRAEHRAEKAELLAGHRAEKAELLAKRKDLYRQNAPGTDELAFTIVVISCLFRLVRDAGLLQRLLEQGLLTDKYDAEPVFETAPSDKSEVGATALAVSPRERSIARWLIQELNRRPAARSTIAGAAVYLLELEGHAELAELFAQLFGIQNEANRTVKPVIVAWYDGIAARLRRPQLSVRRMSELMNLSVGSISAWRRARLHQKIVKKVVSYPAPTGAGADWVPDLAQVHDFDVTLWPRRAARPGAST